MAPCIYPGNKALLHMRPKCADPPRRDARQFPQWRHSASRRVARIYPRPTELLQLKPPREDHHQRKTTQGKRTEQDSSGPRTNRAKKRGEPRSPRRDVFQAFYACAPGVTGLPNRGFGSAVTHPRGRVSEVRVLRRMSSPAVTATHPSSSPSRPTSGKRTAVYGKRS